ncbi:MAG: hypothetical protein MJZ37_10375 [Bacilli bacterium]|nr:hypothetical protein [Bacilli bacterium]
MIITDSKGLLSPDQIKLVHDAASLPFSLGEYVSLDDILTTLNVDVVVEDGVCYHDIPYDFLKAAEEFWRKRYEEAVNRSREGKSKEIIEAEENISEVLRMGNQMILGLYVPTDNHIILYPEAMKTIDDGRRMDELLVSVLAHETMHAYFNRPGHEMFPYALFFEEPLAEFGMLLYLDETKSPYLKFSYEFVKDKDTCYRFGAKYYDEYKSGGHNLRNIVEDYKFELEHGPLTILPSLVHLVSLNATTKKGLSKSRYTLSRQCQKALWLSVYDKEKQTIDPSLQARFEEGNIVGDLAMGLLGPYVDVTVKVGGGTLDLHSMIQRTKDCLVHGVENICEASFAFRDKKFGLNYCAVDILHKNGDGYDIYEVKSSSDEPIPEKWLYVAEEQGKDDDEKKQDENLKKYTLDIAYQKWTLEKCGVKINNCYLIRINKKYIRKRFLSVPDFFVVKDMNSLVAKEYPNVEAYVLDAQKTLSCISEPKVEIGLHCSKPYHCTFKDWGVL